MIWITGLTIILAIINIYLVVKLRTMEEKVDYIDNFLYDRYGEEEAHRMKISLEQIQELIQRKIEEEEKENGEQ